MSLKDLFRQLLDYVVANDEQEIWDQEIEGRSSKEDAVERDRGLLEAVRWQQTLNAFVLAAYALFAKPAEGDIGIYNFLIIPSLLSVISIILLFYASAVVPRYFGEEFTKRYIFWFAPASRRGTAYLWATGFTAISLSMLALILLAGSALSIP